MPRQFLVICRVGDRSLHKDWIADKNRNFDLYLSYFGSEERKYIDDADFYEQVKGPKWPAVHAIFQTHSALISTYDAVWIPDDDLLIDTDKINHMFNIFSAFKFDLAQPALTLDSHVIYKELIADKKLMVRHTNFVEAMAPIFSKNALDIVKHSFGQSPSGWGLDNLWPVLLNYKNIGVIDSTPIIHTRPLMQGELYQKNTLTPKEDVIKVAELYPTLNIFPNHPNNQFRVFSHVKINILGKYLSSLTAKITRKRNKKRYNNEKRYQEAQPIQK